MPVREVVRDILHTRGVAGLFTGLTPTVLREVPGNVIYFGSYEFFRCATVVDAVGWQAVFGVLFREVLLLSRMRAMQEDIEGNFWHICCVFSLCFVVLPE